MDICDIDALCAISCIILSSTLDRSGDIVHVIRTSDGEQRSLRQAELAALIESTQRAEHQAD
jgi:hypothetical protein